MLNKSEFKDIFESYFDSIRRFIFYRCGNTEAASDIAQDVFMTVWEKREQIDAGNLKNLLFKIANDKVITDYRKQQSRMEFEKYMALANDRAYSMEEQLQGKELKKAYARALQCMPEKQRVVFLLNRNEGFTYTDIASRLNISVKAVEKRMNAALKLLRTHLKE
ncbi:MAG: RNA polymerase sigma-70 factor [Tannerellaceae bacterium]|jgi:RNA polymerase sigma-70 factor (ECF subfamily)|nr:RNA polymerase sigma-70 factor [Tannerellaceae bacterium]